MHLYTTIYCDKLCFPGEDRYAEKEDLGHPPGVEGLARHECLLVNGARQVGKSFALEAFGRAEYESYIAIDFVRQPALKGIFGESLTPDDMYSRMTLLMPNVRLVPGNTLIFIDEIQECPEARSVR